MAAAEEDFSFPATTTDSPPQSIDSPPLWQCSPFPSPTPTPIPSAPTSHHVKPEKLKGKEVDDGDEEEEKMDMLWEDLNDESAKSCGKMAQNSDISSPGREVQINCVKALNLSKTNGLMVSGKKPSILIFIKVLKKVFSMQNSHRSIKKRSW